MASFFDIGRDATRVASISYGSESREDFDFNAYSDQASLVAGLNALPYKGGGTATYLVRLACGRLRRCTRAQCATFITITRFICSCLSPPP